MIRWGLFGGQWPPVPWEAMVALGGSLLGAGGAFALFFPIWRTYPEIGAVELAGFLTAGAGLIGAGLIRRRRTSRPGESKTR